MPPTPVPRLPVTVITGFLGSGKTTLLNSLLHTWPRSGVLINEFGATAVDHRLVGQQGVTIMTLSGGCLCCQVRGALTPMLKNIRMDWGKPGRPIMERLFIETSGIASPEPVLDTLLRDRWLSRHYRLESIITTVAAPSAQTQLMQYSEARTQIAWADRIVITQSDLASDPEIIWLNEYLTKMTPQTPTTVASHGQLPDMNDIMPETAQPRRLPSLSTSQEHDFQSVSIDLPVTLRWTELKPQLEALLQAHPELLRIKGIVQLSDQTERLAIQCRSGQLFPPVRLGTEVPDNTQRSQLVLIAAGPVHAIAHELLKRISNPPVSQG